MRTQRNLIKIIHTITVRTIHGNCEILQRLRETVLLKCSEQQKMLIPYLTLHDTSLRLSPLVFLKNITLLLSSKQKSYDQKLENEGFVCSNSISSNQSPFDQLQHVFYAIENAT